MQFHRMILGLALGTSLSIMSCTDTDLNECQDVCGDAFSTCVSSCTDATCRTGCEAAQTSCLDECE